MFFFSVIEPPLCTNSFEWRTTRYRKLMNTCTSFYAAVDTYSSGPKFYETG
jgi:hypothetical protein